MRIFFLRIVTLVGALALSIYCSAQTTTQTTTPNPPSAATEKATGDSTEIEVIKAVKAVYPNEAVAQNLQGQVVVRVTVSETGDVENPEIISGIPVFVKPAIEAAKQWKFKPFIQHGKPVKIATRIPFDFAFAENVKDVPPTTTDTDGTKRAQVPEGVLKGMLIHRVQPDYPDIAASHRVEGTVVLHAIIGKDGTIKNLKLVSGSDMLARSAIGAVEQWVYKPYLLMGEPVEVESQIVVNFQLGRAKP